MIHVFRMIKTRCKLRMFQKNAVFGQNLRVYEHSGCFADCPGLIKIGHHCDISGVLYSMGKGTIEIGDYTEIRENSFVGSVCSIKIGSYGIISNHVKIYDNNNHPTDPAIRKQMCINGFYGEPWRWTHAKSAPVVIEDNVWIGERSTILKGVTIGEGSVIACNSVVVQDVPPYSVAAGNPARVVKSLIKEEPEKESPLCTGCFQ